MSQLFYNQFLYSSGDRPSLSATGQSGEVAALVMSLRSDYQSRITFDALNACLYRACRDAQGGPLTLHFSPFTNPPPLTSHQSLLTSHGRASGPAFSPGASRLAFGISYPSSSSKAVVSSKDWLNSRKAPCPNYTGASGLKVLSKRQSWRICGTGRLSSCAQPPEDKRRTVCRKKSALRYLLRMAAAALAFGLESKL